MDPRFAAWVHTLGPLSTLEKFPLQHDAHRAKNYFFLKKKKRQSYCCAKLPRGLGLKHGGGRESALVHHLLAVSIAVPSLARRRGAMLFSLAFCDGAEPVNVWRLCFSRCSWSPSELMLRYRTVQRDGRENEKSRSPNLVTTNAVDRRAPSGFPFLLLLQSANRSRFTGFRRDSGVGRSANPANTPSSSRVLSRKCQSGLFSYYSLPLSLCCDGAARKRPRAISNMM